MLEGLGLGNCVLADSDQPQRVLDAARRPGPRRGRVADEAAARRRRALLGSAARDFVAAPPFAFAAPVGWAPVRAMV